MTDTMRFVADAARFTGSAFLAAGIGALIIAALRGDHLPGWSMPVVALVLLAYCTLDGPRVAAAPHPPAGGDCVTMAEFAAVAAADGVEEVARITGLINAQAALHRLAEQGFPIDHRDWTAETIIVMQTPAPRQPIVVLAGVRCIVSWKLFASPAGAWVGLHSLFPGLAPARGRER